MTLTPKQLADAMVNAMEDLKADNVQVLDVRKLTSMCDYMVIGSGRSNRQVSAIADKAVEEAKKLGIRPLGTEGNAGGEWVLVDLGDVVVHAMHPLTRAFYALEKLWGDPELGRQSTTA
jgi:ribosome-associated protein